MPAPRNNAQRAPHEEGVEVQSSTVVSQLERASIDTQIQTAKAFPRSVQKFKQEALELATLDAETARTMFYRLPRANKTIEGPSVRMAEVVGSAWGNLRYGARIVAIEDGFIVAQGMCADLEKNNVCTIEVRRRITDKWGNRYNDDMIQVTGNAASSIALRNAVFKIVPFGMVKSIWNQAKEVSLGKGMTMEQRRENAMKAMAQKIGAKPFDIFKVLKVKGVDDLGVEQLLTIHGIITAIEEGSAKWEDIVRDAEIAEPKPTDLGEVGETLVGDDAVRKVEPEVEAPATASAQKSSSAGKSSKSHSSSPAASTADEFLTKADRKTITEAAVGLGIDGIDMPAKFAAAAAKLGLESVDKVKHSQLEEFKTALAEVA